jgi:hypothetical protein
LLKNIPCEAFEYHRHANPEYKFQQAGPHIFPYLLVNVGSGVSILKVSIRNKYSISLFKFDKFILNIFTYFNIYFYRSNQMKYLKESVVQPQEAVHFGDLDHYLRKERYRIYVIS